MPDIFDEIAQLRAQHISAAAEQAGVPPELALSLVNQESGGNPSARSPKGALGVMQVMPATAKSPGFGVKPFDPTDPEQNLNGGLSYVKAMLDRYQGDTSKALAAYNAGPGAVDKAGGVPNIPETQHYVQKVQAGTQQAAPATGESIFDEIARLRAAQPQAAQPTTAPPPQEEGPIRRFAEGAGRVLDPRGILNAVIHPLDTAKNLYEAQAAPLRQAKADFQKGDYVGAALHGLTGALPIVGPAAAHAGTIAARGDVAGGLGELAGIVLGPKIYEGVGGALAKAGSIAGKVPEAIMDSALKVPQTLRDKNPNVNFPRVALNEGINATNRGMAKAKTLVGTLEEEKNALFDKYDTGQKTNFPQMGLAQLQDYRAKLARGAAPAEDLAAVDRLISQLENHPAYSRNVTQQTLVPQTQQVPTGVVGNNGQPVMQSQTVMVPQTQVIGKAPTNPSITATRGALAEEAENTKGKFGRTLTTLPAETTGRKILRQVESTSLKDVIDPAVLAARDTLLGKVKAFLGKGDPTLTELNARQGNAIALRNALLKREAPRNNANPLSLTAQILGGAGGAMGGGLPGGIAGAVAGHLISKPGPLSLIARGLDIPARALGAAGRATASPLTAGAAILENTSAPQPRTVRIDEAKSAYQNYLAAKGGQ